MATAKTQVTAVSPERLDIRHIDVRINGDSPLIVHAWSHKAKQMMLDKQMKKGTQAKEAKDPERDYEDSLYRLPDGSCGFPATGVKASAIRGAKALGMTMTDSRGALQIGRDLPWTNGMQLLRINGEPHPREDMVRLSGSTADIRYRGEFSEWSIDLPIAYNARVLSAEQIVAMLDAAGFGVGIGEWRPENSGPFGTFHVGGAS